MPLKRPNGWAHRHPLLVTLLTVTLVAMPGYTILGNQQDRIERESKARSEANCDTLNDVKQLISDILALFSEGRTNEPPASATERERNARILARLQGLLAKTDCEHIGQALDITKMTLIAVRLDLAS